ncbi:uncharacterized protein CMU_038290 [Cryptosporidium muris RN66]|uniref:Uncharacterized protein n=1 Tax=Cryptosporidium muris (strain RN66) TaxID=441375 RepID=B6A972_CRYMR|nr:uncharacterized protein CMU_038290 [Cryptosporidium muris RN66]EEA04763.1 hypothetical protein, conserved [Cryptosporidium muris RN66]|eukprot:XP_002139112.1 hypothetical protein [Cryptosporidium muris RN66]
MASKDISLDDLKDVVRCELDKRGILNEIKAKLMAEILVAINDEEDSKPCIPKENIIINSLIYEYLMHNGYSSSSSVLLCESGMNINSEENKSLDNIQILDRNQLLNILSIKSDKNLPILYSLIGKIV